MTAQSYTNHRQIVPMLSPDAIKRAVKQWRADLYRV